MTRKNLPNFKEEKAIAAASLLLRLSGNSCDKYWLNKVMYYVERQTLVLIGQPMFNDSLFSMKYGPVLSNINDAIDNTQYPFKNEWTDHFQLIGKTINLLKEANQDSLSEYEEQIIKDAFNKFKGWSFSRLKKFFHNLPEYKATNSRVDIEYDEILEYSGVDKESIQDALETISYFTNLENSITCDK